MPRLPLLLALILCALALAAAPALATAPQAAGQAAPAVDDSWEDEDPGDEWDAEDPGDDWGDDGSCFVADEDGEILPDEACGDDEDLCLDDDWDDWDGDKLASEDAWGDGEDWGDEGGWDGEDPGDDWSDDPCAEDAALIAPPQLTALRATPTRRAGVRVLFRLDRGSRVELALRRVGGAGASTRCARPGRAALRQNDKRGARKARRCAAPRGLRGTVTVTGRAGANATTLRRWKGRPLQPGSYRLTATPAATGGHGKATAFTLRAATR